MPLGRLAVRRAPTWLAVARRRPWPDDTSPRRPLASAACPLRVQRRTTIAAILACAGLLLVGWTGLLVPSLIRSIEPAFDQTDAGIGVFFFVNAVAYVGGSMVGGFLTERIGRRVVLPIAVSLIALGLAGLATVPTWELFLVADDPVRASAAAASMAG